MSRAELTQFEKYLYDDEITSSTEAYDHRCYICRDPDFARRGLPLCLPCPRCQARGQMGHIAADDCECSFCGYIWDGPHSEDPIRTYAGMRGEL